MKDSAIFLGLGLVAAGGVAYLAASNKSGDSTLGGITSWIQQVQSSQSNLTKAIVDASTLQNTSLTQLIAQLQTQAQTQNATMLSTLAQMFQSQTQGLAEAIRNIPQPTVSMPSIAVSMPNVTMPSIDLPDLPDLSSYVDQANAILGNAQSQADKLLGNAQETVAGMLAGAQSQADKILADAQAKAEQIKQEAEGAVKTATDPLGTLLGGVGNLITQGIQGLLSTTATYPILKNKVSAR